MRQCGGIFALSVAAVISQMLGVDLTGLVTGGQQTQQEDAGVEVTGCTGADAHGPAACDIWSADQP